MMRGNRQRGYILLPVVLLITLVAITAFMLNNESTLDSGITASSLEARQAEYVARAGLNHALWQTAQQGCGPYNDLGTQALAAHSYSAALTTDLGKTASYTLALDQDSWISSALPATNYAGDSRLHVRLESGVIERALYRYDLSPLPAYANILSATAWFYVNTPHPQGPVDIHFLNTDWTETNARWNSMDASMDMKVQATIPAQAAAGVWVAVNLTTQVQAWVNGRSNYGIALNASSEGTHGEYASREAGEQPYLEVIVGTPPTSPATLQSKAALDSGISRTLARSDVRLAQQPSHRMLRLGADTTEDAWITGSKADWNYGGSTVFNVNENGGPQRGLLRFDLARALPGGARVTGATLELFAPSASGSGHARLYGLKRDWVEGGCSGSCSGAVTWNTTDGSVTWTSAGSDADATAIAEAQAGASGIWYRWDITPVAKQWASGERANHGLLLTGEAADFQFNSSDHADASTHPRLMLSYSCECGSPCLTPQGEGRILMVVSDEWNMAAREKAWQALFESWGYTTDLISQWDVGWNFDAKAVNNDVVYVTDGVTSTTSGMAPKLAATELTVINEEGELNDELGFSSTKAWPVGHSVTVIDNSHYITRPFATGTLRIASAAMEGLTVSGSLALGLQPLATVGGNGTLVALEAGAALEGGGTAPGRRVMLPVGRDHAFNLDYLNNNGRLLVQRALAWGMRADALTSGTKLLMVVSDDTSLTGQEEARKTLIESWGYLVNLIDDAASQTDFNAAVTVNDVVFVSGEASAGAVGTKLTDTTLGIVNEQIGLHDEFGFSSLADQKTGNGINIVDNTHEITSGFSTGTLTITTSSQPLQALSAVLAPGRQTLADLKFTGSDYRDALVLLDSGAGLFGGGSAAGRRVQLPWGSSGFDFTALNDNGQTLMRRSLVWASAASAPKQPIAHWKLDETSGTSAMDSADGHDGSLRNGPLWVGGQVDGGLYLDGINDYVGVSHDDALSLNEAMTFTAWVKASAFGSSYQTIIAKDGSGSNTNFWFGTWRRELAFGFFTGGSFREQRTAGLDLQPGSWYHVAATFNNASNEVILYVDGFPVGNGPLTASPTAVSADLTIGRSSTGEYWPGRLDEVRIYDQVLARSEIAALAVPSEKRPVAHWKFDETSGSTAVDSAGGHDGSVDGAVWMAGQIDGGLGFDGVDDNINASSDPTIDDLFTGGGTLTAWIRPAGWGENDAGRIADKADTPGGNRDGWAFGLQGASQALRFEHGFSSGLGAWQSAPGSITLGNWQHVAVVYDSSAAANDPMLYINGVAQPLTELVAPAGSARSDNPINFTIGNYALDKSRTFDGVLDDVRIYKHILDGSEIAALAAAGGGGPGPGPGPGGCNGTFRDEFDAPSASGSNGTLDWSSSPWVEVGESDGASAGDVRVTTDLGDTRLRIRDNNNGGEGAERAADLSGATIAILSFDYRRMNLDNSNDYVAVSVSAGGTGGPWTELDRIGTSNDAGYQGYSRDISAYISDRTAIRLRSSAKMGNTDTVWFDNVQIQCSP